MGYTETSVDFEIIEDFTTPQIWNICTEWSPHTFVEKDHMLPHSPQWMINNYSVAVIATKAEELVAAAGMIPVINGGPHGIYFENQQVFELCSNFVNPKFREQGIATKLVLERLVYAREHNWLPVVVTKEAYIISIAKKFGLVQTLNSDRYKELGKLIRDCSCQNRFGKPFVGNRCNQCPLDGGKTIWVFPPEVPL
jgi:predicted GNAT family acetyltransferase